MRSAFLLMVLVSAAGGVRTLAAQPATKVDVGMHAGATILIPSGGGTEFVVALPGGGTVIGLFPPVYATIFLAPNLMVEPQVAILYQSFLETGLASTALQVGYLIRPTANGSPYFAAHLQAASSFGDASGTEFAAGASLGYRHVLKEIIALRYEARYRRWFDARLNEVALLVGFGVAIR